MLSRRELLTAGAAGSLTATPGVASAGLTTEQQADRDGQREIARSVQSVERALSSAFLTVSLAQGFVAKLRQEMEVFLRANNKFPDYIDIGVAVFLDMYDWHVRNRQQLVVTRADNRYHMQFMFITLVLRVEQDRNYVGIPYDRG